MGNAVPGMLLALLLFNVSLLLSKSCLYFLFLTKIETSQLKDSLFIKVCMKLLFALSIKRFSSSR